MHYDTMPYMLIVPYTRHVLSGRSYLSFMRLESGILAFSQVLPLSTILGFRHFFLKSVILSEGAHWGVDQLVYCQGLQGK